MFRNSCLALLSLSLPLLSLGCGGSNSEEAPPGASGAEEIGTITQSKLIVGRDGGGSSKLWGRSVWAFGDSVSSVPDVEGETWHHNSFAFTDDFRASDGIELLGERTDAAGAPSYLIAPTADEAAFNAAHRGDDCKEKPCGARYAAWPGAPLFDATRNRAIVPYGLVWAAPGDMNFRNVGHSFAIWSGFDSSPERPVVDQSSEHPTLLFAEDEPEYGMATVIDGDELFAFACSLDWLTFHCTLGKVALDHLLERAAWRYWDGTRWSDAIADAQVVLDASAIFSVDFNHYLGKWTAIYSGVVSNDVLMRTAPSLTGPWSEPTTLLTTDRKGHDGTTYDAYVHPEYSEQDGRVLYLSYSRPNGDGWFGSELALVRVILE